MLIIYIYFNFSDNLRFGLQFSRKFVDGSEPIRPHNFKTTKQKRIWSNRLKMNLHNNEVGRQVIQTVMIFFFMIQRCNIILGSIKHNLFIKITMINNKIFLCIL